MKKRSIVDASERMRLVWLAYQYPGQMVLRDIARLRKMFKRAQVALAGRNQPSSSEEDSESYLWAERRE
jgi:hypothetical protein